MMKATVPNDAPLVVTGPGGEYRRAWSEDDIDAIVTAAGWRPSLIALAVVFVVGIAAAILFDTPVKRPPASDVVRGVVDGAAPAAATF